MSTARFLTARALRRGQAVWVHPSSVPNSFLGRDQRTVFRRFTNGVVTGHTIRFQYETWHPYYPIIVLRATVDYTVPRETGRLHVAGAITSERGGYVDIPYLFRHTSVTAVAMPVLTIRASAVEVCWPTESNLTYQVQSRALQTTNDWADLGPPVTGTGSPQCVSDALRPGDPPHVYRVLTR